MIPQYVAASLVSENKVLSHPASVDSIPTSAGQEDHVSMGNAAGLKAWQVLANAEWALAIELLAGVQAVEFLAPLEPGAGVESARAVSCGRCRRGSRTTGRSRGEIDVVAGHDPRRFAGGRGRGCRCGGLEVSATGTLGRDGRVALRRPLVDPGPAGLGAAGAVVGD